MKMTMVTSGLKGSRGIGFGLLFWVNLSWEITLFSTFLKFIFLIYKAGSQTWLSIDVGVMGRREAELNKFKRPLMMPSEASQKQIFTACPSDNYLFHEKNSQKKIISKILQCGAKHCIHVSCSLGRSIGAGAGHLVDVIVGCWRGLVDLNCRVQFTSDR